MSAGERADEDATIVAAHDDHESGLIALIKPIFEEYDGVIFDLAEMPELRTIATSFAAAGGAFWCAFRADVLVGCVGWVPSAVAAANNDDLAGAPSGSDGAAGAMTGALELRKLYVAKSERGAGLGGRLARRVERAALARGANAVELWSDAKFVTAHRFYERNGYLRDGRMRALNDRSNTVEFYFRKPLPKSELAQRHQAQHNSAALRALCMPARDLSTALVKKPLRGFRRRHCRSRLWTAYGPRRPHSSSPTQRATPCVGGRRIGGGAGRGRA